MCVSFELELIDTDAPSEAGLETRSFFDGQGYTEAQIIERSAQSHAKSVVMPNALAIP